MTFDFIVEGVLLTTVCVLGFFGNVLSIYVLLKPSVRGAFSALLTALVTFDAFFLVCSLTTLGLPNLSETYKQEIFFSVSLFLPLKNHYHHCQIPFPSR